MMEACRAKETSTGLGTVDDRAEVEGRIRGKSIINMRRARDADRIGDSR